MKIERRNISDFESIAAFGVFILVLIFCANYSTLNNLLIFFLIFGIIIFFYFFKARELKPAEIDFLDKESKLLIEHRKNEYLSGLSFLFTLAIYIPFFLDEEPKLVYFGLIPAIIIGSIAFYFKYKKGGFIFIEKLYFTSSQIVFMGRKHTVINHEDIEEIILGKLTTLIKEKHGKLKLEVEKVDAEKRDAINAKLKSIALAHSIRLDERNLME